jgi:hypothetical protein
MIARFCAPDAKSRHLTVQRRHYWTEALVYHTVYVSLVITRAEINGEKIA